MFKISIVVLLCLNYFYFLKYLHYCIVMLLKGFVMLELDFRILCLMSFSLMNNIF